MSTQLMTQRDRTELRRITKARFALLEQQLQQRQNEVREMIRADIEGQYTSSIKEAARKSKAFEAKREKLAKKVAEFEEKIKAELVELEQEGKELGEEMEAKGIAPYHHYHRRGNDLKNPLGVSPQHWYDPNHALQITTEWTPVNLNDKVNKAFAQLANQAGLHAIDLEMQKLELEEQLAIGALGSDEAKEFLAKVPTLDKLLPEPDKEEVKQLTSSVMEA